MSERKTLFVRDVGTVHQVVLVVTQNLSHGDVQYGVEMREAGKDPEEPGKALIGGYRAVESEFALKRRGFVKETR